MGRAWEKRVTLRHLQVESGHQDVAGGPIPLFLVTWAPSLASAEFPDREAAHATLDEHCSGWSQT